MHIKANAHTLEQVLPGGFCTFRPSVVPRPLPIGGPRVVNEGRLFQRCLKDTDGPSQGAADRRFIADDLDTHWPVYVQMTDQD